MNFDAMNSLDQRISNMEKIIGLMQDDESPLKEEIKNPHPLLAKTLMIEYKTKEIYITQIEGLIKKLEDLDFLIKNGNNLEIVYKLEHQKARIILENMDLLKKAENTLKKFRAFKNIEKSKPLLVLTNEVYELNIVKEEIENKADKFTTLKEFQKNFLEDYDLLLNELNKKIIKLGVAIIN